MLRYTPAGPVIDATEAVARLPAQERALFAECGEERSLSPTPPGETFVERCAVVIPTMSELVNKCTVTVVECTRLPYPPERFGMARVAAASAMLRENVPKTVQFTVLGEEMFPAQVPRMNVPDAHGELPTDDGLRADRLRKE